MLYIPDNIFTFISLLYINSSPVGLRTVRSTPGLYAAGTPPVPVKQAHIV